MKPSTCNNESFHILEKQVSSGANSTPNAAENQRVKGTSGGRQVLMNAGAFINKRPALKELLYTLLALGALLIIWQAASVVVGREILIPSPKATFDEVLRIMGGPRFLTAVGNTLKRAVAGFAVALVAGLGLGLAAGFSKPVYYLLRPFVLVNKAVPTMAMILLAIIWLESEKAPVLVSFVVVFPILYENVVQGIRQVDPKLVEMMHVFHQNRWQQLKHLYLPSIGGYLNSGMAAAMALNLKIIIAAEVLSQPRISMGTSFQIERASLNTAGVFAWSFITIVLAALLEQGLRLFKRKMG